MRGTLHRVLTALALLLLVVYLVRVAAQAPASAWGWTFLVIAPLYLAAHCIRALRLFLLCYDGRLRFAEVLRAHFHAAGVSALIPFKLGEVYRIAIIDRILRNPVRAALTVWIERLYDIILLAGALAVLLAVVGGQAWGFAWFFAGALLFLFLSFFLFVVLPENLTLLKRYLILRHNSERALLQLRALDRLHAVLRTARTLWRYRWATMLWLSFVVWFLEAAALALVVIGAWQPADVSLRILHRVMLRSSPWGDSAGVVADIGTPGAVAAVDDYRHATIDVLAAVALTVLAVPLLRSLLPRREPLGAPA